MKKTLNFTMILIIGLLSFTACSYDNHVRVSKTWARPGVSGGNSAVYLIIDNPSDQVETLLSASSEIANSVELHMSTIDENGNMTMTMQDNVYIPARSMIEFKPGGLHIMLISLTKDLQPDDSFQLTLKFRNSGELLLDITVKEP